MNSTTILAILAVTIGCFASSLAENVNDDRIYGGKAPWAHRYPYTVSLREQSRINDSVGWNVHRCGGSIISDRWILSAAWCTLRRTKIAVVVGAHAIQGDGKVYLLDRVIDHPAFNKANHHNDLSLLRTIETIQFGPRVKLIPLRRQFVGAGIVSIITGWGKKMTWAAEHSPTHMEYLNVNTTTNAACTLLHSTHKRNIYAGTICADAKKQSGPCREDEGSPMATNNQLIGVVSWFSECDDGLPAGYTRVSEFLPWIEEISGVVAV